MARLMGVGIVDTEDHLVIQSGAILNRLLLREIDNYGYSLSPDGLTRMINGVVKYPSPSEKLVLELSQLYIESLRNSEFSDLVIEASAQVSQEKGENRSGDILPLVTDLITDSHVALLTTIILLAYKKNITELLSRLEKMEVYVNKEGLKAKVEFQKLRDEINDE
jgi:hypothetical protein